MSIHSSSGYGPPGIPSPMLDYLDSHHVLALAVCAGEKPWAASVFYAMDRRQGALIFLSSTFTRHGAWAQANPHVSGAISDQQWEIASLRGLQLAGETAVLADGDACRASRAIYDQRFPAARNASSQLWLLRLDYLKFTDNTLGFGHKIEWFRLADADAAPAPQTCPANP